MNINQTIELIEACISNADNVFFPHFSIFTKMPKPIQELYCENYKKPSFFTTRDFRQKLLMQTLIELKHAEGQL
jgi:hypothetical protein